jgi:post-segregation antitoxin (ccd killing protein)
LDNRAIVISKSLVTPSVRAEVSKPSEQATPVRAELVEACCEPVDKVRNWKRWAADNAEAIAHYNARIEREG